MRYHALACDYDGTVALDGRIDEATEGALRRLRASGRKLLLVTGRELPDLQRVCPQLELFDRVVVENGALLYRPAVREEKLLAAPAPEALVALLRKRGVDPSVGRSIVATWEPHETAVLECIHELGLELQVIFNKGAVMVLPTGTNKATGLTSALEELGLSAHNVVGVGDAENDHAFLTLCECSVAVANALPAVKDTADFVTEADHGQGVAQLVERLLASDLRELEPRLLRRHLLLGRDGAGNEMRLPPYGTTVLLAGASGGGKSTFATAFVERLVEAGYQFCIADPEGDYERLEGAVVLGDSHRAPGEDEVLAALEGSTRNVVVSLVGLALQDRPHYFEQLVPRLQALRARTGRPHWLIVDETHHMLPTTWDPSSHTLAQELHGVMFITVHPDHVSPTVLGSVDLIVAVGERALETAAMFARTLGEDPPAAAPAPAKGHVLAWWRSRGQAAWFLPEPPRQERRRHVKKYADGDLGEGRSFYFRGPEGKLNLKAQNLSLFLQMANGVDDETWLFHLRQGDYSRWFEEKIKDPELAEIAARVERSDGTAAKTRAAIEEAVNARYTAPA